MKSIPFYFQLEWVLDGKSTMTGNVTLGNVWTFARAWQGMACGEARLEASSSTFTLKVENTAAL
jgi:hypothetical protein